jgi:hypothetical protein
MSCSASFLPPPLFFLSPDDRFSSLLLSCFLPPHIIETADSSFLLSLLSSLPSPYLVKKHLLHSPSFFPSISNLVLSYLPSFLLSPSPQYYLLGG